MNSMQIISVVVFLVVMIALVTEKVHRTAAAVSGAVLLLCLRILSVDEAVSYIDFGTIGVLIGMMLFVAVVRNSGLFEYMAIKSAKIAKGSPWKIMLLFMILTAVLSAFLDNVTTVLLVGPMAISIAGILGIDPVPFLLTQILASNIGGTATLIGDPPNIIIGSAAGLSFMDFVRELAPIVALIMAAACAFLLFAFRKSLRVPKEKMDELMRSGGGAGAITDRACAMRSITVLSLVILGFMLHDAIGFQTSTIALAGAAALLVFEKPEKIFRDLEWNTIFFFIGLFIIVGALEASGGIKMMADAILKATRGSQAATSMIILWGSGFISGIIDNIPYTATMTPMILEIEKAMGAEYAYPLWWSLSLGACLGGNMTIIGAAANVIVSENSAKHGHKITFMQFFKYGFIVMLISLAISAACLWLKFFI